MSASRFLGSFDCIELSCKLFEFLTLSYYYKIFKDIILIFQFVKHLQTLILTTHLRIPL
jgi:hypothetical protein